MHKIYDNNNIDLPLEEAQLTDQQIEALRRTTDWYNNQRNKPFFTLGGYAGCVMADTEIDAIETTEPRNYPIIEVNMDI